MPPELIAGRFMLLGEKPRAGGLSQVWKAADSRTGAVVALKLLNPPEDDDVIKIFLQRETETLGSLQHPNIVRLLDFGWATESGRYYMALEWVERNLKERLDAGQTFGWQQFFDEIGRPLVAALSFAHAKEIEHRDIKPGNILIDADGTLKLADFGIAKIRSKVTDPEHTVAAFRSGVYGPPEVEDDIPYVRDVFAFGVLAIKSLSSQEVRQHTDLEPALNALPDIPPEVRNVLYTCIALEPADRFKNAAVLEQKLLEACRVADQRMSRKHNAVWLRLTRAAAAAVLRAEPNQEGDYRQAEAAVLADLGDQLHVDYGFDAKNQSVDTHRLTFAGRTFLLKGVPDERYSEQVCIISVTVKDEDSLRRWREKAVDVSRLLTLRFEDPGEDAARAGLDFVLDRLDERQKSREAKPADSPNNSTAVGDLYSHWGRLLDAREALARGERKPIPYTGITQRNRKVTFQLDKAHETSLLGEEWEVAFSAESYSIDRGEVIEQSEDSICIQFRRQPTRIPRNGVLVPYLGPSKVALQRQEDALANIKAGQTANPLLTQILQDPATLQVGAPVDVANWSRKNLDKSKQDVVRHALGSQDLVLVQGPPGTGKTTVIVEIVRQTIQRQPHARILIVSQTHIAVDNALERLESADVPGLVRLGKPDDPRVAKSVRHMLIDQRIKKWAQSIRKKAAAYLTKVAAGQGLDARHLEAALLLEELAAVMGNATEGERAIGQLEQQIGTEQTSATRSAAGELINAREKLDQLLAQGRELIADVQALLDGALTLPTRPSVSVARSAVGALLGDSAAAHRLKTLLRLQGEWLQRIDTDKSLITAFLRTTHVVGGTALGFLSHPAARDIEFDLCIFDEASKATATETLVPLARARRWILVGDTNQLPPMDEDVLRQPQLMREYDLSKEVVEMTLFQYLSDRTTSPVRHMLAEQYRMVPAIGNLISVCFYGGKLISPSDHHLEGYERLNRPVLWINTRPLGDQRRESQRSHGNTSIANPTEAGQAIERLDVINRAIERNWVKPPDKKLSVLVIAPYGRQVEELRRRVAGRAMPHLDVDVLSVDAVQGRECDIAVFSVTRSNDRNDFGFIGEPYWRRINVALSRARFGLIIVGDAEFCRSKPGALREVLNYIGEHPEECEIRDAAR